MLDINEVLLGRRLERHVWMLAEEIGERNLWRYGELQKSADYITGVLEASSYRTERQAFRVNGREVHNLVAQLLEKDSPIRFSSLVPIMILCWAALVQMTMVQG